MCLGDQKRPQQKCTVRASIKAVKKENKRIRNDRTRLLQEVRAFYKRYFSLWEITRILWNPGANKKADGRTINENICQPPGDITHSKEKTTNRYTPSLFGYQPQSFANGENSDVRDPYEIGGRNLHPR